MTPPDELDLSPTSAGARPSDQALVSDQAAARLDPSGFDPSRIDDDFAEQLAVALFKASMKPYREIAEQTRAEFEATFTGDDADLQGYIGESHVAFGMACAFKATEELAELQALEASRFKADMRGVAMWRAANPGNERVLPDHGDLVAWLLAQIDSAGPKDIAQ